MLLIHNYNLKKNVIDSFVIVPKRIKTNLNVGLKWIDINTKMFNYH